MNGATASRMGALGTRDFVVASRTPEAAASLASAIGGRSVPLSDMGPVAREATIIVSATRSPGLMLTAGMLAGRLANPLVVADLAVPRDVDPAVGALPGVRLIDIDHLHGSHEPSGLREAIAAATGFVEEATLEWQAWYRTRAAVPLISELRAHVDQQRDIELARAMAQLDHLSESDRAVVEELAHRLVNKMFHQLAVRMKRAAAEPELGEQYLEAVRFLFAREDTWRISREAAPEDYARQTR
jgi:glutamyl-tRNA reductase